jgi:nuclear pore complex protein Nup62
VFCSTSKPLSFAQLEQLINRWTYDVEEQEKAFLNQATEVNAWDRVLRENGAKVQSTVFMTLL